MKGRQIILGLAALLTTASSSGSQPTKMTRIRSTRLEAIVLPFHTNRDGLPLIDGLVDATPGVFLFDTGSFYAFLVNRNLVPLEAGIEHSRIHAASGQTSVVYGHPKPHQITLAGRLSVAARGEIDSATPDMTLSIDAKAEQKEIDANLIGWVGWGFLKDYVFILDYNNHIIRFEPINGARRKPRAGVSDKGVIVIKFTPSRLRTC